MNILIVNVTSLRLTTRCSIRNITKQANLNAANTKIVHKDELLTKEEQIFKKHEHNVYYSDYLQRNGLNMGYKRNFMAKDIIGKRLQSVKAELQQNPIPISLKFLESSSNQLNEENKNVDNDHECGESHLKVNKTSHIHFPFKEINASVEATSENTKILHDLSKNVQNPAEDAKREIRTRLELLNKPTDHLNWMNDYENFPLMQEEAELEENNKLSTRINYGTANPAIATSNVPCGGCGALLHCKDTSIPGYIPSEIFQNHKHQGAIKLEGIHCQRCHFLKHYNMALQVRVSPSDYPKVLSKISEKQRALVILMVDLLDFPCSIYPGIPDLIGMRRPIFVVGNKVDLLPDDGKGYLNRVKDNLIKSMKMGGFAMTNIQHVALISAKTGFGIEDLITSLNSLWQYRGDVYIVGCTNVGKSSLFNALLQSDYCKNEAEDLIQRATTSPWPGTTLNLLKFPILRPTGWRQYVRHKRLETNRKIEAQENELRQQLYKKTKDPKYAALIGNIERSFMSQEPLDDEKQDIYALKMRQNGGGLQPVGLNMRDQRFALSKYCYDTPGVVQPEQIIHEFTTDELIKVFPKVLIRSRTFSMMPGSSLFIAGIARVDYCEGDRNCRFTVFASHQLPITICKTSEADVIYRDLLRTEAFGVPVNDEERLKLWPGLEASKSFSVTGIDWDYSCADLVLSNAGWVAITPDMRRRVVVRGWTPEARGIHLRDCLLPNIVRSRGKKIRRSCAYKSKV